ncbi:hypothetical protein BURKHO8Y_30032 [Burkholderia sp. 8Y]|nr:hypothetical protein BURKHO8Y_30032 [Burkholderia sp. 8Y]
MRNEHGTLVGVLADRSHEAFLARTGFERSRRFAAAQHFRALCRRATHAVLTGSSRRSTSNPAARRAIEQGRLPLRRLHRGGWLTERVGDTQLIAAFPRRSCPLFHEATDNVDEAALSPHPHVPAQFKDHRAIKRFVHYDCLCTFRSSSELARQHATYHTGDCG